MNREKALETHTDLVEQSMMIGMTREDAEEYAINWARGELDEEKKFMSKFSPAGRWTEVIKHSDEETTERDKAGELYAIKNLSNSALKIYLLATSLYNGYEGHLRRSPFKDMLGISYTTYKKAIQELEDKHFLVEKKDGSGEWYFSDAPIEVIKEEENNG